MACEEGLPWDFGGLDARVIGLYIHAYITGITFSAAFWIIEGTVRSLNHAGSEGSDGPF